MTDAYDMAFPFIIKGDDVFVSDKPGSHGAFSISIASELNATKADLETLPLSEFADEAGRAYVFTKLIVDAGKPAGFVILTFYQESDVNKSVNLEIGGLQFKKTGPVAPEAIELAANHFKKIYPQHKIFMDQTKSMHDIKPLIPLLGSAPFDGNDYWLATKRFKDEMEKHAKSMYSDPTMFGSKFQ